MSKPSDRQSDRIAIRAKIMGLGEKSKRKSYYPQLQARIEELEEKSATLLNTVEELERAREKAEESERGFRVLFEHIADGILVVDIKTERFVMVNESACRMLGYAKDDLLSLSLADIHPASDLPSVRKGFQRYARGVNDSPAEVPIKRRDGDVFWAEIRAMRLDLDGRPCMMGVLRDITERRRAKEALQQARDTLEQRVEERTFELEAAMKKLQDSNQALQDFTSIASHDLQEPLRKVNSFGKMLKHRYAGDLGEEGKDYLDRMLSATGRMQTLLKSLLDYSRVSTKAEPFREVDIGAIVRDVLSDLEVRVEKSGGRVEVGDLPIIHADPTQMRQLFQNLIGNALKFHKEGEAPVVRVHCSSNGPDSCEITIEDNGIGFEEHYLERIFAPFQRLHGRSSRYEGTGMGLAICKKIVERHGGTVTARSAPGEGSTFTVHLPVRQDSLGEP